MGNKGITEQDIFDACEKLESKKVEITIKSIRDEIGSGSFSTISKYMEKWKSAKQGSPLPQVPEPVLKVAQNFWNTVYRHAEVQFKDQVEAIEKEKLKWAKEIESYRVENEKLEIAKMSLEKRNAETIKE